MRTIERLTVAAVDAVQPDPSGKLVSLCDGDGLWLQVRKGSDGQTLKHWVFRYRAPNGRTIITKSGRTAHAERNMGLGPARRYTLAEAREMAKEAKKLLDKGLDPLDQKKERSAAQRVANAPSMTFDVAAEGYVRAHESSWKSEIHRQQWRRSLKCYASPIIGSLDVKAVTVDDVLRCVGPIWLGIPETASRVRGRIETVLAYAGRGLDNPARWDGLLEFRLAKRNKARTAGNFAALPYEQMAEFMADLRAVDTMPARALELAILTGGRTNEVRGANWGEIDFEKRLWTVPCPRMKRDREHIVPLSDAAIALLDKLGESHPAAEIFPSLGEKMLETLRKLRPPEAASVHGFRSSFSDWAHDCTDHDPEVIEVALSHAVKNRTKGAYRRRTAIEKRRVLMADWAAFCAGKEDNGNSRMRRG
jgi:integrase